MLVKKEIRILAIICLILASALGAFAQTKSIDTAVAEISAFTDAGAFSISYDESKYLTSVELNFEILGPEDPLRKRLKKYDLQLTSFYTFRGIDANPVRNVLCINSQSKGKEWIFARENALTIFFENDEIEFGEPNRSTEIRRGKASENMCWEISQQVVGDLAAAELMEIRLGSIRTIIPLGKVRLFKDYAKLLEVGTAAL